MTSAGIPLIDICRHAASALGDGMQAEEILADLAVIRGRAHWGNAEPGWLYAPGEAPRPLSPDMRFDDMRMCLHYIGHVPVALLYFHDTDVEWIEHILGDSGCFNPFTTLILAFRDGAVAPFRCTFLGDDGARHVLTAPPPDMEPPVFGKTYRERALEWLQTLAPDDASSSHAASGQGASSSRIRSVSAAAPAAGVGMRHVIFDAGPWPRSGRVMTWIVERVALVIPKGNPDFEEAYTRVVRWWLEINPDGGTEREIAFDAEGRIVAIGPLGRNAGMFTDIEGCPDGIYGHVDAHQFEAAWDTFAQGRE